MSNHLSFGAQIQPQPPASIDLGMPMWQLKTLAGMEDGSRVGGPPRQSDRNPLTGTCTHSLDYTEECPGSDYLWKIRHKTTEYRLNPVRRKINKEYMFNKALDLHRLLSITFWSNLSPGAKIHVCIRFYNSQCTSPYPILLEPSQDLISTLRVRSSCPESLKSSPRSFS